MKTLTTEEVKAILTKEFGINEDTFQLNEMKGYRKSIKFIKEWSHKQEFLTFDTNSDGSEMIVSIKKCAVC